MLLRQMKDGALPNIFGGDRRDVQECLVLAGRSAGDDSFFHQAAKHGPDSRVSDPLSEPLLDLLRGAPTELVDQQSDLAFGGGKVQHDLRRTVDSRAVVHDRIHKVTLPKQLIVLVVLVCLGRSSKVRVIIVTHANVLSVLFWASFGAAEESG
jgi:hypothetical protein